MAIFSSSRPSTAGRVEGGSRRGEAGLTIIAIGTTVTGDLMSEGVVKVEGTVEGTVRAGTQLLVAPGATIRGDVFAAEVIAGGDIHGTIHGEERVEIQAGAQVHGDIRTQRLHIADGGKINGQITMELQAGDRGLAGQELRPTLSKVE